MANDSLATRSTVGAIVLLGLLAAACGSSNTPTSPIPPTNPEGTNPPNLLTVTITNGRYSPNPVMVKAGQSVNWLNSDSIAHSDNGDQVTFNTPGTFNYHCALHANETAAIVVTQ